MIDSKIVQVLYIHNIGNIHACTKICWIMDSNDKLKSAYSISRTTSIGKKDDIKEYAEVMNTCASQSTPASNHLLHFHSHSLSSLSSTLVPSFCRLLHLNLFQQGLITLPILPCCDKRYLLFSYKSMGFTKQWKLKYFLQVKYTAIIMILMMHEAICLVMKLLTGLFQAYINGTL